MTRWVATWEDVNLAEVDGSGMLTLTVARDPHQPRGPRVTGADHDGQRALLPRNAFLLWYIQRWR